MQPPRRSILSLVCVNPVRIRFGVRKLAEDAYRNVFGEPDEDDDPWL